MNRTEEIELLEQLEQWNSKDEYSQCIQAIEAIPEQERGYLLTVKLSRAYSNLAVLGDHGVHGTDAVSYTHLDVYKRQPLSFTPRTIIPPSRLEKEQTVSYTSFVTSFVDFLNSTRMFSPPRISVKSSVSVIGAIASFQLEFSAFFIRDFTDNIKFISA